MTDRDKKGKLNKWIEIGVIVSILVAVLTFFKMVAH